MSGVSVVLDGFFLINRSREPDEVRVLAFRVMVSLLKCAPAA